MGRGDGSELLEVTRSALDGALIDSEEIALRRETAQLRSEIAAISAEQGFLPSELLLRSLQKGEHPEEVDAYLDAATTALLANKKLRGWSRTVFRACGYQEAESPYLLDAGRVIHIRRSERAEKAICGYQFDFEEKEIGIAIRSRGAFAEPDRDLNSACQACRKALARFSPDSPLRQAANEKRDFDPLTAAEHAEIEAAARSALRHCLLDDEVAHRPSQLYALVEAAAHEQLYPLVARKLLSLSKRPRARAVFNFSFKPKGLLGLRLGIAVRSAYGEDGNVAWPGEKRLAKILQEAFNGASSTSKSNQDALSLRLAALLVAEQWPKAIPLFLDKKRENHSQELIDLWSTHPKSFKIVADYFNRPGRR